MVDFYIFFAASAAVLLYICTLGWLTKRRELRRYRVTIDFGPFIRAAKQASKQMEAFGQAFTKEPTQR